MLNYNQQPYGIPQQNYRPQQAWVPQQQQTTPLVRPVSSIEEVRAYPIDFDGSIFYFPDVANKKIYTKSINMDGTVAINLYELKALPTVDNNELTSYITREEFEIAINQLKNMYEQLFVVKSQETMVNKEEKQQFQF